VGVSFFVFNPKDKGIEGTNGFSIGQANNTTLSQERLCSLRSVISKCFAWLCYKNILYIFTSNLTFVNMISKKIIGEEIIGQNHPSVIRMSSTFCYFFMLLISSLDALSANSGFLPVTRGHDYVALVV
jgi:hypothetical protein